MANPALGHKSYFQVGTQSAYDTAVAATLNKLELISEGVEIKPDLIDDPSLYDGQSHRALIDGGLHAEGPIRCRANYEGFLQLFRGVLGGYTSAPVETGVRSHTFVEGTNKILTGEIVKGDIPTGKCFRLVGGKVRGFTFELQANGMGTFEFDFLGKDLESNVTPTGALSFPGVYPMLFKQCAISDGTADITADVRVRSIKLNYTLPLTTDRFYIGSSANMDEPLPADFVVPEWEIKQEFKTKAAFDAARAFTEAAISIQGIHPETIGLISNRSLLIRSQKCKLVGYSNPVEGYGVLTATAKWRARRDTTDSSALYIQAISTEVALA